MKRKSAKTSTRHDCPCQLPDGPSCVLPADDPDAFGAIADRVNAMIAPPGAFDDWASLTELPCKAIDELMKKLHDVVEVEVAAWTKARAALILATRERLARPARAPAR